MLARTYVYRLSISNILIVLIIIGFSFLLHNRFDNNSLFTKEYLIKNFNPKVIFSGDSRAARHLNPRYVIDNTNYIDGEIVNIAINSGDPLMIENLIEKYPHKFIDSTLIISISDNQLNDNAKKVGYFSNSMISKLDYYTQLKIFLPNNIDTLLKYYRHNFKIIVYNMIGKKLKKNEFVSSYGFDEINENFDSNNFSIENVKRNPWYINYQNKNKIKINLLKKSLRNIKSKVKNLYVYSAPYSPKFTETIQNTKYYKIVTSMLKSLSVLCGESKIKYKSYAFDSRFENEHFYDSSHLNAEGAKLFTKIVMNDVGQF